MDLIRKLGLLILSLGLAANITGNRVAEHYNNQIENAAVVLENTVIKTDPTETELDKLKNNFEKDFEKYELRENYANGVKDLSYITMLLGFSLTLGWKRIRITTYRE